jgi:hypothetical protein
MVVELTLVGLPFDSVKMGLGAFQETKEMNCVIYLK